MRGPWLRTGEHSIQSYGLAHDAYAARQVAVAGLSGRHRSPTRKALDRVFFAISEVKVAQSNSSLRRARAPPRHSGTALHARFHEVLAPLEGVCVCVYPRDTRQLEALALRAISRPHAVAFAPDWASRAGPCARAC